MRPGRGEPAAATCPARLRPGGRPLAQAERGQLEREAALAESLRSVNEQRVRETTPGAGAEHLRPGGLVPGQDFFTLVHTVTCARYLF
jgi:hypothetical protein